MWSTFLLRFGLLGIIIKHFKWALIAIPLYLFLMVGERGIRLVFFLLIIFNKLKLLQYINIIKLINIEKIYTGW